MTKPKTKKKPAQKPAEKFEEKAPETSRTGEVETKPAETTETGSAEVGSSEVGSDDEIADQLSDQNLDAGEDMGFSDEDLSNAAEEGANKAVDDAVLEALDGSGAELGDLADDLHLSEAEVRGAVRRLETAGKVVVEKDEIGGGTYVNLPGEGDEKKVHAVKTNGASSNGATAHFTGPETVTISGGGKSVTFDKAAGDRLRGAAKELSTAFPGGESEDDDDRPTRNLKCILTADEKAEKARLVAENFKTMEDLEGEREQLADDLKAVKGKIDGLNLDNRRAMRANREGYEYRDVVCEEQTNLVKVTMDTVRLDTLEIIDSRALTKAERQGDLFGTASP